jgi:hypothetical protein
MVGLSGIRGDAGIVAFPCGRVAVKIPLSVLKEKSLA